MDLVHLFQNQNMPTPDANIEFGNLLVECLHNLRPFLSFYHRKIEVSWSFSEYVKKINGLIESCPSVFLLPQGSSVLVMTGNRPETYLYYGALLAQGLTVVPVDPDEAEPYIETVIQHAKVKAVLTSPQLSEKLSSLKIEKFYFSHHDIPQKEGILWRGGQGKTFFFTSGTTGEPKAVTQNFPALRINLEGTRRAGKLTEVDVLMSCLPLFHVNAFNFSFLLPLFLKCRMVYTQEFPLNFWKILTDERVTVASLSPPIVRLLNQDQRKACAPPTLRYVISASSALYQSDLTTFIERFGARIHQAYGLSETVNFTLFTPPDLGENKFQEIMMTEPLPSAGAAVWGNDVFLLDENGDLIDEAGITGELAVRGWNVHEGYYDNLKANEDSFSGGYFHTGDAGYFKIFESQRFYYLTGRLKEVVKRQGKLIYLSEVDAALKTIGLTEACAVGFPNDYTEEEVGLYLVRSPSSLADQLSSLEILNLLRKLLSFSKCPKVIVEGQFIPRTAVGKIKRMQLRSEFKNYKDSRFHEV